MEAAYPAPDSCGGLVLVFDGRALYTDIPVFVQHTVQTGPYMGPEVRASSQEDGRQVRYIQQLKEKLVDFRQGFRLDRRGGHDKPLEGVDGLVDGVFERLVRVYSRIKNPSGGTAPSGKKRMTTLVRPLIGVNVSIILPPVVIIRIRHSS